MILVLVCVGPTGHSRSVKGSTSANSNLEVKLNTTPVQNPPQTSNTEMPQKIIHNPYLKSLYPVLSALCTLRRFVLRHPQFAF